MLLAMHVIMSIVNKGRAIALIASDSVNMPISWSQKSLQVIPPTRLNVSTAKKALAA